MIINKDKKFPRGVEVVTGGVIRNKDGKILLTKSPKWHNKWTLCGGHIEPGEKILDSAKREIKEETGLIVRPVDIFTFGELVGSKDFHRPAHFIYFDCLFDVIGGEIKLQKDELNDYCWVTPEEALKMDLAESYADSIQKYIEIEKSA